MALIGKKASELLPEEVEFLKEAAEVLRREGEKLERALESLRAAEHALEGLFTHNGTAREVLPRDGSSRRQEKSEFMEAETRYRKAWERAQQAHYRYIVQREAVGFRTHRFVEAIYPLPPFRKF